MGRQWVSKSGNLYASGLFPIDDTPLALVAQLSFAASLAISDTVAVYAPDADITLKWPNDVLVGGAKISGILLETGQSPSGGYVIVGIGLNVEHHPDTTLYPATHLLAHMSADALSSHEPLYTGLEAVLATLSARFEVWRGRHAKDGFAPLREAWLSRAHGIGQVATIDGKPVIIKGLGENGELQVSRDNGTIDEIFAGDVFFAQSEIKQKG